MLKYKAHGRQAGTDEPYTNLYSRIPHKVELIPSRVRRICIVPDTMQAKNGNNGDTGSKLLVARIASFSIRAGGILPSSRQEH